MRPETRKSLFAYSLFDFANSSFTLIFHAYLFPLYLKDYVLKGNTHTDLIWGGMLSVSALAAALVGPFIGRIADRKGRWLVFAITAVASFVSACILALLIGRGVRTIVTMFVFASCFYYLAANLYDSLLKSLAGKTERAAFSGFAWGFGYLGGIVCFGVVFLLQRAFGINSVAPFLFTGLFYGAFGAYSLYLLKAPLAISPRTYSVSLRQMFSALTKRRIGLLLGYLLIADTIGAIIAFTSLYASDELGLSPTAIGGFLLCVQIFAVPSTYLVSRSARRFGTIRVLGFCVVVWSLILLMFVSKISIIGMFIVTFLTALVIGSTQALMRSQYSEVLEKDRDSEQFGWYGIATESASIIAPIVFGISAVFFGSKRVAMAVTIIPLVLGFLLVAKCFEAGSKEASTSNTPN